MSENLTEEKLAIEFPKILKGKKALVSGVANKRSIAWGIAQALHAAGAEVIFLDFNTCSEKS